MVWILRQMSISYSLKILSLLLLFISGTTATGNCPQTCEAGSVSCLLNGELLVCVPSTDCVNGTEVLRVTSKEKYVYGHKNQQATFEFNVTSTGLGPETVTVISPDKSSATLEEEEVTNSEYDVDNTTKAMEGSYTFIASGEYSFDNGMNKTACAADDATLYVYTISVKLGKAFYVFNGETTSIDVTVEWEGTDWSRIRLYEHSPLAQDELLHITADNTVTTYTHPYIISAPVSGRYTFEGREFSLHDPQKFHSTNASAEVYVLTTRITVDKTSYYAEMGDNVSIPITVTKDGERSVTIRVTNPTGQTDIFTTSSFIYDVYNVERSDLGKYKFSAFEIIDGHGPQLSAEEFVTIYTFDITTTNLAKGSEGNYKALKGQNSTIKCQSTDASQNIYWLLAESKAKVSSEVTSDIFQENTGATAILHITDRADYRNSEGYLCDNAVTNESVSISVEGSPDQTSLTFADGKFTCKSFGNPIPSLTWSLGDIKDWFDDPIDETGDFHATSVLTPKKDLSCLGNTTIYCAANNQYSTENSSDVLATDGDANVFLDEYIIFRHKQGDFEFANETCGGTPVTLKTREKEEFVRGKATTLSVTEFYVGATKHPTSGKWTYLDGSDAHVEDNADGPGLSCAKYSLVDETWKLIATSCAEKLNVVCEIRADDPPTNLRVETSECNGTILNVTWNPPAHVTSQIISYNGESPIDLDPTANETVINNLSPNTTYRIKVEAVREFCQLYPFVEEAAITVGPANAPVSPQLQVVNGTECVLTWSEIDPDNRTEGFVVTLFTEAVVDTNGEFPQKNKSHDVDANTFMLSTHMKPNTNYTATIFSKSCAGNSANAPAIGSCSSPIGTPDVVPPPKFSKPSREGIIDTALPEADNRFGPVTCQFLVVQYVADANVTNDSSMDNDRFQQIKHANDDVNVGDEYFAYATTALSSTKEIKLGEGGTTTSCIPSPSQSSERTGRSIEEGVVYEAENRKFLRDVHFRYYQVVAVFNGSTVFLAKSVSSGDNLIAPRDAPSGSNAAVIVLSILASIIVLGLLFYLYRKCRRPKNRPGFLRFSYSSNSEHDYDTL